LAVQIYWSFVMGKPVCGAQGSYNEWGKVQRGVVTHFLQDGSLRHMSKKINDLLKAQDFEVIDWPGNSPDLNQIENCWK
jgi:hypothetical protein